MTCRVRLRSASPAVALALAAPLGLGGCDRAPPERRDVAPDPVVAAARGEELMVDPDLSRQNPAADALGGGGPASAPLPPLDRSAETIAAARAEAATLAGGVIGHAPPPGPDPAAPAGLSPERTAIAALAQGGPARSCVRRLDYSAIWAARLPQALPVYPRGHVQEAAGADGEGCRLRVITYLTPVPLDEVIDFYWTRARRAGLAPIHRLAGTDHVLSGGGGAATYAVYGRERDGLTEIDLVTSGL